MDKLLKTGLFLVMLLSFHQAAARSKSTDGGLNSMSRSISNVTDEVKELKKEVNNLKEQMTKLNKWVKEEIINYQLLLEPKSPGKFGGKGEYPWYLDPDFKKKDR